MEASPKPPRKRILVIEDEPGYQELMESILGLGPFDLTVCPSVEEAMVKIDTELFDLIITDINLQGMTGFQVLGKMKAMDRLEACPVIMCSSQFDPQTKEQALNMGAAGFIPKPYELDMVTATVKAMLGVQF
jgi:DNA-binding response OmpR family regulator